MQVFRNSEKFASLRKYRTLNFLTCWMICGDNSMKQRNLKRSWPDVGCSSAVICINSASCWRSDSGTVMRGVWQPDKVLPGLDLTALPPAPVAVEPPAPEIPPPPPPLTGGETSLAAKLRRRFGVTFLSTTDNIQATMTVWKMTPTLCNAYCNHLNT